MDFFQDFLSKNKILQADLKSVSKISLTIREGFLKTKMLVKFFFFIKSDSENYNGIFEKKVFFREQLDKKILADGSADF